MRQSRQHRPMLVNPDQRHNPAPFTPVCFDQINRLYVWAECDGQIVLTLAFKVLDQGITPLIQQYGYWRP